jgi:hypothetical protein
MSAVCSCLGFGTRSRNYLPPVKDPNFKDKAPILSPTAISLLYPHHLSLHPLNFPFDSKMGRRKIEIQPITVSFIFIIQLPAAILGRGYASALYSNFT